MAHTITSRKKSLLASTTLFVVGLIPLAITASWWPGIMLLLGFCLALRQYLLGKHYDVGITLVVFGGTFVTVQFEIEWKILLPILFSFGALYVLIRELITPDPETEVEKEEEIQHEIEED